MDRNFYQFLHKQIPVLIILALFPGLAYVLLGYIHDIYQAAIIWYVLVIASSTWGYRLYAQFRDEELGTPQLLRWYRVLRFWFYLTFALWGGIFVIYVVEDQYNMHYIAIFTELGASLVASTLLISDKVLYRPIIIALMSLLMVYFASIGEWFGYILTIFAAIFAWVLIFSANSSHRLLMQFNRQASHDSLTGLYNRRFLNDYIKQSMNTLNVSGQYAYLLLIDLDHFKTINDSLGHDVGDDMLQEVALRLNKEVTEHDMVARLGGDEFIIIGSGVVDRSECQRLGLLLAENLVAALKRTYIIDNNHLYISASIGVSIIRPPVDNASDFIKQGDIAMYEAKARGRNGVFLFSDEMSERIDRHLKIERLLHFALDRNEISIHYQPQYDQQGALVGAESLVRWSNAELGNVSPMDFIPIAEQTGIIVDLGNYILASALRKLADWQQNGLRLKQFSINVSMQQFFHYNFINDVEFLYKQYLAAGSPTQIIFEITETLVAEDVDKVVAIIQQLKALGIHFSMDDFGTGYSSLAYLKRLPIDEVKIDRAFVRELGNDEGDQAMVKTILNMASIFKLKVVAEGVETEQQLQFLRDNDCDLYQGYYFSKPLSSDEFEKLF